MVTEAAPVSGSGAYDLAGRSGHCTRDIERRSNDYTRGPTYAPLNFRIGTRVYSLTVRHPIKCKLGRPTVALPVPV